MSDTKKITINSLVASGELENSDVEKYYLENNFSSWIYEKGNYYPAIEVEVVKRVKSGVYKLGVLGDKVTCIPQKLISDSLYLLPDSQTITILQESKKFWERTPKFAEYGMIHKRGILLEGPPGTGKTATITLLINELLKEDGIVFLVGSSQDFTIIYDFYKNILRKIEPTRKIITVIEDIDKIATGPIEPQLLDFLDGKMSINHHLVIATTNDSSGLSDALLRPSRIDMRVIIDFPSSESRTIFFENKGVEKIDIEKFVNSTTKFSISQLKELFIGTYVLGNNFDQVIEQIKNPLTKKRYDSFEHNKPVLGF